MGVPQEFREVLASASVAAASRTNGCVDPRNAYVSMKDGITKYVDE